MNGYPWRRTYRCNAARTTSDTDSPRLSATDVSRLLDERESACPSRRPQSREQRSGQSDHALCELSPQVALAGRPSEAYGCCEAGTRDGCCPWGIYSAAIHRWEVRLGRLAPPPTQLSTRGTPQLSPRFPEFLMGLPEGWVSGVPGVTRNQALTILGNGVVPAQCAAAIAHLLDRIEAAA